MLLTDDAGNTLGKRQTAILIKPGMADLELVFLSHSKYLEGPCRADLATESAVEFTITGPGNQIRREHPLDTGPEHHRLQAIGDRDLHTLATADAAVEELGFNQSTRRSNQQRVGLDIERPNTKYRG